MTEEKKYSSLSYLELRKLAKEEEKKARDLIDEINRMLKESTKNIRKIKGLKALSMKFWDAGMKIGGLLENLHHLLVIKGMLDPGSDIDYTLGRKDLVFKRSPKDEFEKNLTSIFLFFLKLKESLYVLEFHMKPLEKIDYPSFGIFGNKKYYDHDEALHIRIFGDLMDKFDFLRKNVTPRKRVISKINYLLKSRTFDKNLVKIDESVFYHIEKSIVACKLTLRFIKKNRHSVISVKVGSRSGIELFDYLEKCLNGLLEHLNEIADEEAFLKYTNVRIQKRIKGELQELELIKSLLEE